MDTLVVVLPLLVVIALAIPLVALRRRQTAALPHQDALAGLDTPQRGEVREAVRTGRPVNDPALAGPAAAWAEHEIAAQELGLRWQRALRWAYAAAGVIIVATSLIELGREADGTWILNCGIGALLVVVAFSRQQRYRNGIARARAALDANG